MSLYLVCPYGLLDICIASSNSSSMLPIVVVISLMIHHVSSQEFSSLIAYRNRKVRVENLLKTVLLLGECWKKKTARNWANLSVSS